MRIFFLFLVAILLPASASALSAVPRASFQGGQSLVATSSSAGNSYAAGASVVLTAPVGGDLVAAGGSVIMAAPVGGDALIIAGTINKRSSVAGDLRAIGGSIDLNGLTGGDVVAGGVSVRSTGAVEGSVFVVAGNAAIRAGASGPVHIYANTVALGGEFADDVTIMASGRVSLAPDTHIRGKLTYEAPDNATIPATVRIDGGVSYSNAAYLPDVGTSRVLAYLSIGFFLVVRILGALILAGLLSGLFPEFAQMLTGRVSGMRIRSQLLLLLLGFGILVATPIVISILLLTFVGIGLAVLLLILYALLFALAFMYAGIVVGGLLVRRFRGRMSVRWHDGVLGMLVISFVALVPYIGLPLVSLLMLLMAGTLLQQFFEWAFPRDTTV